MKNTSRRQLLAVAAALAAMPGSAWAQRVVTAAPTYAYGDHPSQRLDVFPQEGLTDAPVVVFVHGGGWQNGDKSAVNNLPAYARRNGFLLVSVGYRLAPEVDAGGCAEDVAAAIAWVKTHAAEHGGDPNRIFLVGHSAGAHLVALVGVDPQYLGAHGLQPRDLSGVIALDGAGYDAVTQQDMLDGYRPLVERRLVNMYGQAFGDRAAELSPTRLVRNGVAYPPMLVLYVPSRSDARAQSEALAAALRGVGSRAIALPSTDPTHRAINVSFGRPRDPEGEMGAQFVRTGALPQSPPRRR